MLSTTYWNIMLVQDSVRVKKLVKVKGPGKQSCV